MSTNRPLCAGISSALALALAATSFAEPRESVTFNNVVSEGINGNFANTVLTNNFAGGYTASKIRFSGTLYSTAAGTWPEDSRIQVTTPTGQTFTIQPFTTIGGFSSISTPGDVVVDLPTPVAAAGTWTFRFFESYDDVGTDALWEPATFTLDDAVPPPPPPPPTFAEVEPNNSKSQATNANGLVAGNTIGGTATGSDSDYFKLKTAAAPLGIYRHRITITTTGAVGHTCTIRGLEQQTGFILAGTDVAVQTTSAATTPARTIQWYGFGRQEELFVRVAGTSSTTSEYRGTYSVEPAPFVDGGTFLTGDITITRSPSNTIDADFMVYDASMTAIPGYSNDGGNTLTREFAPGTYYIAFSDYNTANDQPAPADDTFPNENVLDFPHVLTNSSTSLYADNSIQLTDASGGPVVISGSKNGFFDVTWFKIVVAPPSGPTPPRGVGAATPNAVAITGATLLTVQTFSGFNPPSTGMQVHADLSSLHGSSSQVFYDDGTHGDQIPGDNIFSYLATLAEPMSPGVLSIPFTVSDAQLRSRDGTITLTATAAPTGGCCTAGACAVTTAYNCTTGGGTYNGNGSDCNGSVSTIGTSSSAFPIAIPAPAVSGVTPGVAVATLTMPPGSGTANNLAAVVGLTHTWIGDIHMTLSNGSTVVDLVYRPEAIIQTSDVGSDANYNGTYVFSDGAAGNIWAVVAGTPTTFDVPSGHYYPSSMGSSAMSNPSLAAFNGAPLEGTWTLTVEDWWTGDTGNINSFALATVTPVDCNQSTCGTSDFDGDGDYGTDFDIESFFACLAGNCCATCWHNGSDFNGDGDYGTDADIEAFFRVLAGGNC